jgi:hypothetical protein
MPQEDTFTAEWYSPHQAIVGTGVPSVVGMLLLLGG